jgi:hypothetical protein
VPEKRKSSFGSRVRLKLWAYNGQSEIQIHSGRTVFLKTLEGVGLQDECWAGRLEGRIIGRI